jgi:hypothetical protein
MTKKSNKKHEHAQSQDFELNFYLLRIYSTFFVKNSSFLIFLLFLFVLNMSFLMRVYINVNLPQLLQKFFFVENKY